MPYRNDRDAREARREARARRERPRAPLDLRPSRGTLVALGLAALSLLAASAAFVGPRAAAAPAPAPAVDDREPDPTVAPTPTTDPAPLGGLAGLGALGSYGGDALGTLGATLTSGLRTARPLVDTLFHVPAGTACQLDLRTHGDQCEALVRCGAETLYHSAAAYGLVCTRGLGGEVTSIFDRETTRDDGSPALTITPEEIQLVDDAEGARGVMRLTLGPPPVAGMI